MSGTPPYDDAALTARDFPLEEDRARWQRTLEHVRAIRAALAARDFLDSPGVEDALDAAEAAERRRYVHALRRAAAAERAAQELAEDLEEAVDLAEVIELRPTAEEHGK